MISGNGIKIDEPKQNTVLSDMVLPVEKTMSDNELINRSIDVLQGKKFNGTI